MKGDKIYYRKGFKYQLAKTYSIQTDIVGYDIKTDFISLTPSGILTLYEGYASDGPSGPTLDSPSSMRGAFVHDGFYQLERLELISQKERIKIDKLLHDICEEDGMWKYRADVWLWAVRNFGASSANPEHEKPVIEAP